MNPYAVVIASVIGRERSCAKCRARQVIARPRNGHYHCRKCGHRFTREELLAAKRS